MPEVVYGRVSPALKQALTTRAGERGLSLNASVCELLERGLAESAQEAAREELEAALAASGRELEETRARLAVAEGRLVAAATQEERTQGTLRALAEPARLELGLCPARRGDELEKRRGWVVHRPRARRFRAPPVALTPRLAAPPRPAPIPPASRRLGGQLALPAVPR